jgi:hypothetical protein
MLLNLAKEFVVGAKISDKAIREPVVIADKGIWHPMADQIFETYEVCFLYTFILRSILP